MNCNESNYRFTPLFHQATSCRAGVRLLAAFVTIFTLSNLSGCAAVTAIASHPAFMSAGAVSFATTGKGLADHALDMVTQQDCRLLDGLVREERSLCEPHGSPATHGDFKGFLIAYRIPMPEKSTESADTRTGQRLELDLAIDSDAYARAGNRLRPTLAKRAKKDEGLKLEVDLHLPRKGTYRSVGLKHSEMTLALLDVQ